jgi:hypothetical protein
MHYSPVVNKRRVCVRLQNLNRVLEKLMWTRWKQTGNIV